MVHEVCPNLNLKAVLARAALCDFIGISRVCRSGSERLSLILQQ